MREELVFFPCGDAMMAGVHSLPEAPNGMGLVIAWGAGAFPSSARNQIRARIARELAGDGFDTVRFDYPGVGEASGAFRLPTMATPYTEEITAAADFLKSRGVESIGIVANCFGSWSSLVAAPSLRGLKAMALINCPVRRDHKEIQAGDQSLRWWAARIKRMRWANLLSRRHRSRYRKMVAAKVTASVGSPKPSRFVEALSRVAETPIQLMLLYGPDGFRPDFDSALEAGVARLLEKAGPRIRIELVEDKVEGFPTLRSQDVVVATLRQWLKARVMGTEGVPASAP